MHLHSGSKQHAPLTMKKIVTLISFVVLSACASGAGTLPTGLLALDNAKVLSVTPPGMGSGILMAFAEVRVSAHHQERMLVVPYGDEHQVLPKIGARCLFHYEARDIEGAVGTTFAKIRGANVIRKFDCE